MFVLPRSSDNTHCRKPLNILWRARAHSSSPVYLTDIRRINAIRKQSARMHPTCHGNISYRRTLGELWNDPKSLVVHWATNCAKESQMTKFWEVFSYKVQNPTLPWHCSSVSALRSKLPEHNSRSHQKATPWRCGWICIGTSPVRDLPLAPHSNTPYAKHG